MLFRPHKPWLLVDLAVIAAVQLAALVYGVAVIYQERPYYTVFAVDRFHLLASADVDRGAAVEAGFGDKPLIGPRLVAATLPREPEALQQLLEEVLFDGAPDIERRPEFWSPYAERRNAVGERAQPLAKLIEGRPQSAALLEKLAAETGVALEALRFLPLVAKHRDFAFVIDETGAPVDVVDVDPWPDSRAPAGDAASPPPPAR